ncbi:MAG: hypothetical protein ACE5ER_09385 [Nitrospinaceae bacterium]
MKRAQKEEMDAKWKKLAIQAVTDDRFKEKLVAKPIEIMESFDLTIPEGVEVRRGHGNVITLIEPKETTPSLSTQVKWWRVRLETIQEFGRDHTQSGETAPDGRDEDV